MKQKSYTTAIATLATFLSIGLGSAYFGYDYYTRYETAYESQVTAEAQLEEAEADLASLRQVLVPDAKVPKVSDKLEAFLNAAWLSASSHDLTVKVSLPNRSGKTGLGGGGLKQYLEDVPNTRLKTGLVEIQGKYGTYADLKGLMADLEQSGGFLTSISVRGTQFKLSYRVYGAA